MIKLKRFKHTVLSLEYTSQKRAGYYFAFLDDIIKELNANKVSVGLLEAYIKVQKQDTLRKSPGSRDELLTFYRAEQKKWVAGGAVYQTIGMLLFVLEADQFISSHARRDRKTFGRLLETQSLGMANFHNSYNLLIHGAVHTDPSTGKNIYHYLQHRGSSPFKDHVFSIAQVYIDCMSDGDYFTHTRSRVSGSVLAGKQKRDDQLLSYIKEKYSFLKDNTITHIRDIGDAPLITPYNKGILSWYVQWRVE